MIDNLRGAEAERARPNRCTILMDLAGPKLRTGPIDQGLPVTRIRPSRDRYGAEIEPARVQLAPAIDGWRWLLPDRAPGMVGAASGGG